MRSNHLCLRKFDELITCILITILYVGNCLCALDPVIILVGPPGAGKGSCSQLLKENYGYCHLSIGDVLRSEIELQTALGREIKETVKNGNYIDPLIIRRLLAKNIVQLQSENKPFILDGFGQNKGEMEAMKTLIDEAGLLPRTLLLYLEAIDAVCQARMCSRSICFGCGRVYHAEMAKPLIPGQCDKCGTILKVKINDTYETIVKRLADYRRDVEQNYKQALTLFPSIIYHSGGSIEECSLFYHAFAQGVAKCLSDASSFVEELASDATK